MEQQSAPADWSTRFYDDAMFSRLVKDYYGGSDFCNWGYWREDTASQLDACENLMEELLALLPAKEGAILDVACGNGATTRYLMKYFRPQDIAGINISRKQIEHCRAVAPECDFAVMDATRLRFRPGSFDCVMCVEAAFHFDTRRAFLQEAHRVLRPGGMSLLSDILFTRLAHQVAPGLGRENWVADPPAYAALLSRAGFTDVRVIDASEECWRRYDRYQEGFLNRAVARHEIDGQTARHINTRRWYRALGTAYYVLASGRRAGRRPSGGNGAVSAV